MLQGYHPTTFLKPGNDGETHYIAGIVQIRKFKTICNNGGQIASKLYFPWLILYVLITSEALKRIGLYRQLTKLQKKVNGSKGLGKNFSMIYRSNSAHLILLPKILGK